MVASKKQISQTDDSLANDQAGKSFGFTVLGRHTGHSPAVSYGLTPL